MTDKPLPPPAKLPPPAEAPAAPRPSWTQPKPKPGAVSGTVTSSVSSAKPAPQSPAQQEAVVGFGAFLDKEFEGLIARMNAEANRLNISQPNRLRVLTVLLMNLVATYGVRGGLAKKDIVDIFEKYWSMQPKPPAPVPAPPPPKR
jgi:hypothetical protein